MKRLGGVSVDMDSLAHLHYAMTGVPVSDGGIVYRAILPRFLDFFKTYGIRATFFIIGSDIRTDADRAALRRAVKEGHELANHTMNHPYNFSRLSEDRKEQEIADCEKVIRAISGKKPVGFRAPGWDIDPVTLRILERRGYTYDSSLFPSYFNQVIAPYMMIKNRRITHTRSTGRLRYMFAPQEPYHPRPNSAWRKGNMNLIEFPITVTPWLRLPFFGTFHFAAPSAPLFRFSYRSIKRSLRLNYELHAVELFDAALDTVPESIRALRHPSIQTPFAKKMELYQRVFTEFKNDYALVPLCEVVNDLSK